MQSLKVKLEQIKSHLHEADILLFNHPKYIWNVGWWVAKLTGSKYSHTGLVTWKNDEIHILEYREFARARCIPLSFYLEKSNEVDIYRIDQQIYAPTIDKNFEEKIVIKTFNPDVAKCITNYAKSLIGHGYSYYIIWEIFKSKIPFLRLFSNMDKEYTGMRVCSTLVAEAYQHCGFDLVPNLSNSFTSPGDLARSSSLNYLCTIY